MITLQMNKQLYSRFFKRVNGKVFQNSEISRKFLSFDCRSVHLSPKRLESNQTHHHALLIPFSNHTVQRRYASSSSSSPPPQWKIGQELCDFQKAEFGNARCQRCPVSDGCFGSRSAIARPLPWWLIGVAAGAILLPIYLVMNPDQAAAYYYDDGHYESGELRRARYLSIFEEVGLEYPERVRVIETTGIGPTAIGSNHWTGGVIFLPHDLVALTNPATKLRIPSPSDPDTFLFEGTVEQLTNEQRELVLAETGILLPKPEEIDYIVGHEASHLKLNHSFTAAMFGLGAGITAHLLLKLFNRSQYARSAARYADAFPAGKRDQRIFDYYSRMVAGKALMRIKHPIIHASLVCIMVSIGYFFLSWQMEKEADINSAKMLNLADAAIELTEKKRQQNIVTKQRTNSSFITASGNDLTKYEHQPITLQLKYLKNLQSCQHCNHEH